jgi:hypothetical protein
MYGLVVLIEPTELYYSRIEMAQLRLEDSSTYLQRGAMVAFADPGVVVLLVGKG